MSLAFPDPITGPAAWRGADLARADDWIWRPSAAQQAELRHALAAVGARRAAEFERADFPLPGWAATLEAMRHELEHGRGFVVLRGLPVSDDDVEGAARLLWGLGCHLGRPLSQHAKVNPLGFRGDLIAQIFDQGLDYNAPNVHGSATSAEQMPHSDPSDWVGLLCVRPSPEGGESRVVSAISIYNELRTRHPQLLSVLFEGFHHDLRNQQAAGVSPVTPVKIPVFSWVDGTLSCGFNSKTVLAAESKMPQPLSSRERAALDAMLEIATRDDLVLPMQLQTGDLQLVNNYAILHSRTAWVDRDRERRRLMLRLWLKTETARPMVPELAAGYVTGAYYDVARQVAMGNTT